MNNVIACELCGCEIQENDLYYPGYGEGICKPCAEYELGNEHPAMSWEELSRLLRRELRPLTFPDEWDIADFKRKAAAEEIISDRKEEIA